MLIFTSMAVSSTWRILHFVFFIIDASCFLFEIFFIIFLFREFCKRGSPLNISYFHLLTIGYLLDVLANVCWGIGQFTSLENISLITEIYSVEQWHNMFLVGITDVLIAFNRFSAICTPKYYPKIWHSFNIVIMFIVILVLPFLIDMSSLFDIDCLLHMYAKNRCADYIKAFYLKAIIVNVAFGLVAILLAVIGIKKLKFVNVNEARQQKLERRFLDQTLLGAILIVLYYSAYIYFLVHEANEENYIIVDTFVTIFYLIQHYAPIFMLFFVYPELFRRYCKFYHINRNVIPKLAIISKITPVSAHVIG